MLTALALALLAAAPADTAWGSIRGTVQSEPSGLPVALAVVEVQSGNRIIAVTADSTGAYLLPNVPAGRQTFRVRHLEHEPIQMEVLVPPRGQIVLDVSLRFRPLAVDTVKASSGGRLAGPDSVAAPRSDAAITDFPAIEGSGVGAGLPGGGSGSGNGGEPGDVLYMRGSAADLKLVLLDGAPVYAPFHMGGLIESFEPGLLAGARLYLGGAPARYDGGISYVLDLATRSANRERHTMRGALDLVSARGSLEGPAWRGATYLVAGRLVHGSSLATVGDQPFPYEFSDALARADVDLGGGVSVAVTGFRNGEGVRIDTVPGRENFARWSTSAGSVRLRSPVLGRDGVVTLAVADFDAARPEFSGGMELLLEAHTRRARMAVDLSTQLGDLRLSYGYSYDRQQVRHRARERADGEQLLLVETSGTAGGWYVEGRWLASRRWVARGGLRSDMFSGGPNLTFAPRASLTWLVSDRAALTLAGGRYHQYVRVPHRFPFDIGVPPLAERLGLATELVVASSDHLSLALDQELVEGVRLGLEGYFKRFENVPREVGKHTSGVDVWVRRGAGPLNGWLGYSLAWTWTEADTAQAEADSGKAASFAGRHILTVGLGGELGRGGRFQVRLAYANKLPYTKVALAGEAAALTGGDGGEAPPDVADGAPLSVPVPAFLRIDAEVSRTWTPRLGARRTELTPYFRLMNALDRRDALFYRYNPRDGARAVATLPVVPVVGVAWKL